MINQISGKLCASIDIQIPFHDLDPTGVVWHGRYFKYFERAREVLMRELDYSYPEMRGSGYVFPVVDASVRYVRPLSLGESYQVSVILEEWELRLVLRYLIRDAEGNTATRGKTVQVAVRAGDWSLQIGCPQELQDKVRARLAQADIQAANE